jgi:anti-sigma regulatory factor (Ser/Thr protein kinase)
MSADPHRHEALLFSTDQELLDVLVPFLTDGFDAGEPLLVALSEPHTELLRAELPAGLPLECLPGDVYNRPAKVIRAYREWMAEHTRAGAGRIRVAGELPAVAFGATWDWWARYEATVDHAYGEFSVWCLCAYNRRTTPAAVLRDVARTHPTVTGPDGAREPSEAYTEPAVYLSEARRMAADPVQHARPFAVLTDPAPIEARQAVRDVDRGQVPPDEVEDLVVAVSETVTNAIRHGRGPVEVRVWPGGDRIVVTVSDTGPGPVDPFAGLMPAAGDETSGRGLWITYQSVNHVTTVRRPGRFTIRMTAGNPH